MSKGRLDFSVLAVLPNLKISSVKDIVRTSVSNGVGLLWIHRLRLR